MKQLVIPNSSIGIGQGQPVGDINIDKAIYTYMATHSYDEGDAPKRPLPVGKTLSMRERILAISLSPDPLRLSKIKKVIQ